MDTEKLLKLNELKEKGAISEEEFQLMKKEILEENSVEEEDEDDSDYEEKTTSSSNSFSLGKIILGLFGIIFVAGIINGINNADESGNTSKSQLEDDFDDEGVNADLIEMFDEKKENEYSFNQKYNNRELTFKAKVYGINPECYIKNIWASEREYIPCVELAHPTQDIQMFGLKTALANAKMQDEKVISTLKKNQKIKLTCTLGKNSFDLVFFVFENCRIYEKKVKVNVNSISQNTARTPSNSGYASNNLINADWWKTATFEDVKREIDKGANVNAKGNDKTKSGDLRTNVTPLMFAIKYGNSNPEIIKFLIDSGADVNAKEGEIGLTVLMYAAQSSENPKIINILISAGANVEARRYNGATTLMAAAIFNNNPQIIETLIKNKADIFATDNAGNKAIDYAKKYNNFNAIQILEKVMNEALTSKQDLTTLDSTTGNSITSFQQDISNLRQTFENIESLLKAGRYTDEITNIPNLAPSIQNSSGGKVSYQASETGGYEISYHDVSFDLCVYLVSYNYDFLDKYNGFKYMTTSEGEYIDEQWFDAKTMLPLSEEQAYKVCKTCGSKCTISWKLGLSGGEVEEFNEEQHSDNQTDEVIWNDGAPQNINQAYENASYSDQVSFAATFAGCIEEQKFNQAYTDSLPIDMKFQMAFSGGSNVSRQCKCIFQAARKYLGDEEYNKAQNLRKQGRDGSADKILEQAIPAAFGECF